MGPGLADDHEAEPLVQTPRRVHLENRELDRKPAPMRRRTDRSDEAGANAATLGLGEQEDPSQERVVAALLHGEATNLASGLRDDLVRRRHEGLEKSPM